jgi:cytochrome c biogenesis protein CcdA
LKFKGHCCLPPHQTLVATKGEVLYGIVLLFVYALGHCLLMLAAGTFPGFVEAFVQAKGVVNFSA